MVDEQALDREFNRKKQTTDSNPIMNSVVMWRTEENNE